MIPVTVVTGFLGSGKTTLLAHLLKQPELARTAVIINEFGAVGIDHELVAASDESYIELETGCLCCTIRGDLDATIADLVARRMAGTVGPFERIVIETSGLADPAPVLNAVMSEGARGAGVALAGVVTTVDAVTGSDTLRAEPQSARQVAVADRIILTKNDLLEGEPTSLLEQIRALNPRAGLIHASHGRISPEAILGQGDVARATMSAEIEGWLQHEMQPGRPPLHDAEITHHVVVRDRPVPALVVTLLLEALADHLGSRLLRLKGLVCLAEMPDRPAVLHGVQHVFHEPQWLEAWPSADHRTRLVLIGRGLSALWVEQLIDALESEVMEVAEGRR